LLDHYLHSALAADQVLYPQDEPIPIPVDPPAAGAHPEGFADHASATAWFTAERPNLLAVVNDPAFGEYPSRVWQIALTLDTFLLWQGHWQDQASAWRVAIQAADRLGHRTAQALAHRRIAMADIRLGRLDDARANLERALELCGGVDDEITAALVHRMFVYVCECEGRLNEGLDHGRQALALLEATDHDRARADVLNAVAYTNIGLSNYDEATRCGEQALNLLQKLGDREGEANIWDTLGTAYRRAGEHTTAIEYYEAALRAFRDVGDRYNEAATLTSLGDAHHEAGDITVAHRAWQEALEILTDLDHADAESVRAKIDADLSR
jgi:tetratricopeptide (TPR) repeat protein